MLITELQKCWWAEFVTCGQSQASCFPHREANLLQAAALSLMDRQCVTIKCMPEKLNYSLEGCLLSKAK